MEAAKRNHERPRSRQRWLSASPGQVEDGHTHRLYPGIVASAGRVRRRYRSRACLLRRWSARSGRVAGTLAAKGSANDLSPGSPFDLQSRQRCLEFLDPRVRHLETTEFQPLQALDFLQFLQPRVRDPGAAEEELPQVLEFLQLLQACVCDLRSSKD